MDTSQVAFLVEVADRDRWLSVLYAPAALRRALFAIHALDLELAKLATTTSDAMLGAIKLAWWRERLVDLDAGVVPAQPVLRALAADVLPRGVSGAVLAGFLLGAASVVMQVVLPADARPFRDAFVYGAVILVLIWRPQGLLTALGTKERV